MSTTTTTVVKVVRQGNRAGLQYRDSSGCWVIRFLKSNLSEKQVERAAAALADIPPREATRENVKAKLSPWLEASGVSK